MGFLSEERGSDSPYIASVMQGRSVGEGRTIRPAECHRYIVIVRREGETHCVLTGPLTTPGVVHFIDGVELMWIKLRLGAFMPQLPVARLLDQELALPAVTPSSFRLAGDQWEYPTFENAETFVDRLARKGLLARDSLVAAVLDDAPHTLASRTVRHRFVTSTGMTHTHIQQVQRAWQADTLLRQGVSILDTVVRAGYYDQPHLTRSLKRYIGHTPAEIARMGLTR